MSKILKLFNEKAIILNLDAKTKTAALKEIANHLYQTKFIKNELQFYNALKSREQQFSTGLGNGLGIPHAQHKTVVKDVVLIARSLKGINWNSTDKKPVHLIFSIALNSENATTQTSVLQELSQIMINKQTIQKIKNSRTKLNILKNLKSFEKNITKKDIKLKGAKNVVAVTACPTGIAHTYMASDLLKQAAQKLNINIKVETQGRGIENQLSQKDIDNADAIILAIDKGIEGLGRFNLKKVLKTSTKNAIKDSQKLIKDALAKKGEIIKSSESSFVTAQELSWAPFKNVYQNLMGGVSRMLPFVIAGGILLGIAFLLDSGITSGNLGVTRNISRWFAGLGKTAFGIFVPILGAYVAYSIVGPEGLMPGFVGGLIASGGGILYGGNADGWSNLWGGLTPGIDQGVLAAGSGFIGSMVAGYIAAVYVTILKKYVFKNVTPTFRGIVAIIAMPISSVLMIGVTMFVLQMPLAYVAYGLKRGLQSLADNNLLALLGIVIGFMMASDMGGPINKVAYVFATSNLMQVDTAKGITASDAEASQIIMAAVMIGGMVPPLVIAFSTLIFKKAYTNEDKQAGAANWLMGSFFITEGAIPFAAKDPKRVIPVIMIASAIASGLVAGLQIGITAPHGGIFVFALLKSHLFSDNGVQIGMGVLFTISSIIISSILGALALGIWKSKAIKANKLKLI